MRSSRFVHAGAIGALAAVVQVSGVPPEWNPPSAVGRAGVMERSGRLLVRARSIEDFIRMGMDPDQAATRRAAALARIEPQRARTVPGVEIHVLAPPKGWTDEAYAMALAGTGDYDLVSFDWMVYPQGDPNDPRLDRQWQLAAIRASDAWSRHTGAAIDIAFVDTGVELTHPDLEGHLLPGYNAVWGKEQAEGGDVSDVNGHGTSTAGACAVTNNGVGIAGVGWDFGIIPVRATNSPSGAALLSDIFDGIVWAVTHSTARIVSVSYAGVTEPGVEMMGEWARQLDHLLVWGVDNQNVRYDGEHPHVTVVSGLDAGDQKAPDSSYGTIVDIAAPAVGVFTTIREGAYGARTGNSYAVPLVSASLAMIWSAWPDWSANQVERNLLAFADDIGDPGDDDYFGAGRVNLVACLDQLLGGHEKGDGSGGHGDHEGDVGRPPPIDTTLLRAGMQTTYFQLVAGVDRLPDFQEQQVLRAGVSAQLNFEVTMGNFGASGRRDNVGAVFQGYLYVPAPKIYTLSLESSDGSRLCLNGIEAIDNDGLHGMLEKSADLLLAPGYYPIRVEFFDAAGPAGLVARMGETGAALDVIEPERFFFIPNRADLNESGELNILDYLNFQALFGEGDSVADFTDDGLLNVFDFLAFTDEFEVGYGF